MEGNSLRAFAPSRLRNVVAAGAAAVGLTVALGMGALPSAAWAADATADVAAAAAAATPAATAADTAVVDPLYRADVVDLAAVTADTSWYVGHESASSYTISTIGQLEGLAQLVNTGVTDFSGKTITWGKASANMAFTTTHTPIGTKDRAFNGTFDGNGVSFQRMNLTEGTSYLGLFGHTGSASVIKNVAVNGSIKLDKLVADGATSTEYMEYIGGVAGDCEGSMSNCTSSVKIDLYSQVPVTTDQTTDITYVGGVAGRVVGNLIDCRTTEQASIKVESAVGAKSDKVKFVVGFIGGIAGINGQDRNIFDSDNKTIAAKAELLAHPYTVSGCVNNASVRVLTYAEGALDRFNEKTQASSAYVGGIMGYSTSNISSCVNNGDLNSGVNSDNIGKGETKGTQKAYLDDASDATDGNYGYSAGYGTSCIGGIVAGWRTNAATTAIAVDRTVDQGLAYNQLAGKTADLTLSDCANTGMVFGLDGPGGVVGGQGSYTTITRCSNSGAVTAARWNSPAAAGIVSGCKGTVSFCYNTGNVMSLTGMAYYTSGICGSVRSIGKDYTGAEVTPEVYACYNSGMILAEAGYRSGAIVGTMSEGYVHDNYSVKGHCVHEATSDGTETVCGMDAPGGTMTNNHLIDAKEFASAETLAKLNALCDKEGWNVYYTLPEGKSYGQDTSGTGTLFQLATQPYSSATDLSGKTATVTTTAGAPYSASMDPVPTVSVVVDGKTLVQNADFRVIGQANTKGVSVSSTTYQATIVGIGQYQGTLSQTASYTISAGSLEGCTISTNTPEYNYQKQKPTKVTVYDAAGNVIDSSQYTWSVDESMYNQTEKGWKSLEGKNYSNMVPYQDAMDKTILKGYPITITATDGSNYSGSITQNCFKINQVALVSSSKDVEDGVDVKMNQITANGQSWNFNDVCDTNPNGGMGDTAKKGSMKVTYTGAEIRPAVDNITYLGKQLKQLTPLDSWYEDSKAWGYKVIYGDPNPEDETHMGDATANLTDVTGTDYAIMTIRACPYSNFDNFVTVYYEITPKDISTEGINFIGFNSHLSSADEKQEVTIKYTNDYGWEPTYKTDENGKVTATNQYGKQVRQTLTLEEGKDYDVTTAETSTPGVYAMTFTGKGNYTGTVTKYYSVGDAQTPSGMFPDVDYSQWYAAGVTFCYDKGLITGYTDGDDAGKFGVGRTMTRAEFATVLWRYSCPEAAASYNGNAANETGMADVESNAWYTAAANWAVANGVIHGYDEADGAHFNPNVSMTFEQMVTIMANLCSDGANETADTSVLSAFTDASSVSDWARGSVAWAKTAGLVNGYANDDGTRELRPQENVSRERAAVVLMNAFDNGTLASLDEEAAASVATVAAAATEGATGSSAATGASAATTANEAAAKSALLTQTAIMVATEAPAATDEAATENEAPATQANANS